MTAEPEDTTLSEIGFRGVSKTYAGATPALRAIDLGFHADHLLTKPADALYAADVITAWASRYIEMAKPAKAIDLPEAPRLVVVQETRKSKFNQIISVGPHRLTAPPLRQTA